MQRWFRCAPAFSKRNRLPDNGFCAILRRKGLTFILKHNLRQHVMGDFAGNIGEAIFAALKFEGQLFMADTQQMQ